MNVIIPTLPKRPSIVCLCGSSRFCDLIAVLAWEFEKRGLIALSMHLLPQWYHQVTNKTEPAHYAEQEGVAPMLDELHLRKIDMADLVAVVNAPTPGYQDGYIGERTRFEADYAYRHGKPIVYWDWLEQLLPDETSTADLRIGKYRLKINGVDRLITIRTKDITYKELVIHAGFPTTAYVEVTKRDGSVLTLHPDERIDLREVESVVIKPEHRPSFPSPPQQKLDGEVKYGIKINGSEHMIALGQITYKQLVELAGFTGSPYVEVTKLDGTVVALFPNDAIRVSEVESISIVPGHVKPPIPNRTQEAIKAGVAASVADPHVAFRVDGAPHAQHEPLTGADVRQYLKAENAKHVIFLESKTEAPDREVLDTEVFAASDSPLVFYSVPMASFGKGMKSHIPLPPGASSEDFQEGYGPQ